MQHLFNRYIDNKCSPDEIKELLGYFKVSDNEILLRRLIREALENGEDSGLSKWDDITAQTYARMKEQMHTEKVKVIPFFKKTWFRVAAAAVLVTGAFAAFQWVSSYNAVKQEIVNTRNTEIGPATNKALLTLADGSEIVLENTANGIFAQQGDTKIAKLTNGQLVYNGLNKKPTEVIFNSINTPRGGQYQLTLSDGSKIWLNAASSLRFPVAFAGNERRIEITGEAYLEVTKNAAMPFIVMVADKGEVEVLGTHFNINAYTDEVSINTTLLEGAVKVTGLITHDSKTIAPGEQAQLSTNGKIYLNKKADTEQAIAWKKGIFNFANANLEAVLRQLSRWYDVDIAFEGAIPQRQFAGEIPGNMNLSQVLRLLEKNNVYCRLDGKKLIVLNK